MYIYYTYTHTHIYHISIYIYTPNTRLYIDLTRKLTFEIQKIAQPAVMTLTFHQTLKVDELRKALQEQTQRVEDTARGGSPSLLGDGDLPKAKTTPKVP